VNHGAACTLQGDAMLHNHKYVAVRNLQIILSKQNKKCYIYKIYDTKICPEHEQ
jgi:hypothetical protein